MANEAVFLELTNGGTVVRRTVADGTSISKGTLCVLADPNTCAASVTATLQSGIFGGILMADKLASDGSTTASFLVKNGVVDLKAAAGAGITVGDPVCMSGANLIMTAVAAQLLTNSVIGYAEETASASEVIRVRL